MSGGQGGSEPPDPAGAVKRKAESSPEEARRTPKRQTPSPGRPDPAAAEQPLRAAGGCSGTELLGGPGRPGIQALIDPPPAIH